MTGKKVWIFTDNYFIKGGIRSMYDSFIKYIYNDYITVIPISKSKQCRGPNIICFKNPLNVIYLFRILLMSIFIKKIPRNSRIYFIVGSPLYAIIPILFSRKVNIWFATTFFDEFLSKDKPPIGVKNLVIWVIELFLIPLYYLLENIIFLSKKVKYFALSKSTKKKIIFNKKVKILYPPMERYWFKKSTEKKEGIISVARYDDPRKDLHSLIKTAEFLKGIEFTVIGKLPNGFDKAKYKNVHFLGELNRKDIKKYYNRSKIFYLPSKQEGLGIVYIEAMASGLPVVTMKNGGAEEVIKNGYNGYLCNIKDYKCAVLKIKKLLSNDLLLKKFGQNAKKYAMKYQQQAIIQMENFYKI